MGSTLIAGPHDPAPIADTLSRMRRLRLRTLLAVLVLVTTLPVAAFAGWLISRWSAQQQALIERQNIEQARAILVAVDKEVESTIASLNVLAAIDEIDAPDKADFIRIATRILELHPGWHSVRPIDNSLELVASTSSAQDGFPVLDPAWARQIIQTGRPAVSKVVKDPLTDQWTISIGVPVHPASRSPSVLGAKVYARMFNDVLQRQKTPLDGVVTLLDSTPRIVARTRNQDKYVGQPPTRDFIEQIGKRRRGAGVRSFSRERRVLCVEPLPGHRPDDWNWAASGPVDEPLWRSFLALVTAGTAVCGGLVLRCFSGRVRRHPDRGRGGGGRWRRDRRFRRSIPASPRRTIWQRACATPPASSSGVCANATRPRRRPIAHRAARLEQETTARRAAEALNRAKDEFIATVSHELRTPLNVIFGWVAILRSRSLDERANARTRDHRAKHEGAGALIEDLLDMSRAIQGSVRLGSKSVDIAAVLEAAIDSLRPTAEARPHCIEPTRRRVWHSRMRIRCGFSRYCGTCCRTR